MANCPKCGSHLRIIDWRQKCPNCGANIVLYDLQERLMKDADKAEVQHYHFQKKLDRLKASFVGSKLAIVRIFTSLIPIFALLLPILKVNFSAPLEPYEGSFSAITIYKIAENIKLEAFSELLNDPSTKTAAAIFIACAAALMLSLVFLLVHFICLMLACSPKGKIRNYTFDIIMLALTAASLILFACIPDNSFVGGTLGIGAYAYLFLMLVNMAVDIAVYVKGIEITHKPCYVGGIPIEEYFVMVESGVPDDEMRQEMYRRLNSQQAEKAAEIEEEYRKQAEKEKAEKERQAAEK